MDIVKGACIAYCFETNSNEINKCIHECMVKCRKDPEFFAEVYDVAAKTLDKRLHGGGENENK
jgi:hypothetical protein